MRDAILLCDLTQWFPVLKDTTSDILPFFSRDTMSRFLVTWMPLLVNDRRIASFSYIVLDLLIQFARGGKEEGQNW
jgi:hypothetical protein